MVAQVDDMFLKEFWELPDDQKDEVIRRWSHSKQIRQEMALVKKLQADLDIKIINLRLECKHYSVQGIHLFEEET